MPALPSWLAEPLWDQFAVLLPQRPEFHPDHPLGCHRRRISDRVIFDKLLQLLRFVCSYEAIADTTCSATTIRSRRDEWIRLGVFARLKQIALESYDRIVGLALDHIAVDGSIAHKGENAPIQASSAWARGAHPRLAERLLPARPLLRAAGHRHRRLLRSRRAVRGSYDPAGCDGPRLRGSYEARPVRAGPWQRAGSRGGAAKSEPGGAGGSIGPSGMQGFGD
ncbi:hypothetical protein GCM10009548_70040 [Streptomyces malaysiensis subsp. malaysiensis]